MVLHYLKEGKRGENWQDACAVAKDLVWSTSSEIEGDASEVRMRLLKLIPALMKRLREGLKEVSFDGFRLKTLMKSIEECHVKVLHGLRRPSKSVEGEETAKKAAPTQVAQEEKVVAKANPFDGSPAGMVVEEHNVETSGATEEVVAEEIVLLSAEPSTPEIDVSKIDENDPFVKQVEKFAVGCWFEFQADEGGKSGAERCKLAAIIKSTGKYIFVNRSGVKVAEKSKMGLAVELRRGSVQILNDGLLFDRALESIITSLRARDTQ